LQQTQVATVLARYYHPFLQQFPTLEALAAAPPSAVVKAWQGLGYYNRAANLHRVAAQAGGRLPESVDALMALPGIGRNTAHAIAAFAFHAPVPVMEANVKRVLCRIFALEQPGAEELWERAEALLDRKNPFDYNQAMMDIGALVCTKRAPKCGECPANVICAGKAAPEQYPAAKTAKKTPVRRKHIFVLRNTAGKFFMQKREGAFLRGMYGFVEEDPSSRRRPGPTNSRAQMLADREDSTWAPAFAGVTKLGHITQVYSHFTLEADIFCCAAKGRGAGWFTLEELRKLPHSKAEEKIIAFLSSLPRTPADPPVR